MKLTLLQMTQNILSAMDSDNVNSIGDTVESQQVALIIQETFYELMSTRDWPFLRTESQLTGLGDTSNPTKMKFPDGVNKVFSVKYNKKDVTFVPPKKFRDMIDERNTDADNVNAAGYITDRDPLYWTSYDDTNVWFDSIDNASDTTLQQSKSWIEAVIVPTFTMEDTFVPDIPAKFFSTLLAEAKATCFVSLKQTPNQREEMRARRGRVALQNESWRNEEGEHKTNRNINYGRK